MEAIRILEAYPIYKNRFFIPSFQKRINRCKGSEWKKSVLNKKTLTDDNYKSEEAAQSLKKNTRICITPENLPFFMKVNSSGSTHKIKKSTFSVGIQARRTSQAEKSLYRLEDSKKTSSDSIYFPRIYIQDQIVDRKFRLT